MSRLFGTDGVRGIANKDLSCELAFKLGQSGAYVLAKKTGNPRIVIGKDTRVSGDMLEAALCAGICSTGATAVLAGVIPTPGIAFLTNQFNFDAGVVISASHNPVEYNGIKFFDRNGYKLPDEIEDEIEAQLDNIRDLPTGTNIGKVINRPDLVGEYEEFLLKQCDKSLKGLKIALDCANGASSKIAPELFRKLGAEVMEFHNAPDGFNINEGCGSTHIESISEIVKSCGADIGLSFDGDADRLIACDETGEIVDGDVILGICAADMKKRGVLKQNTLVVTVMSNVGLELSMKKEGISLLKTAVGDRYVLEAMQKHGCNIGGEQSGHIIFGDLSTTGDGMQTAVQLINVMVRSGKKLSELKKLIEILPQVLVNAKVKKERRNSYLEDEVIAGKIKELEQAYNGNGRLLIRPSGTEPLIRVMIEGYDQQKLENDAKQLAALIESRLNS